MSNIQIAHTYANKMASMLNDGSHWVSAKPDIAPKEVAQIVSIYRQYFKTVKVSGKTIVCVK